MQFQSADWTVTPKKTCFSCLYYQLPHQLLSCLIHFQSTRSAPFHLKWLFERLFVWLSSKPGNCKRSSAGFMLGGEKKSHCVSSDPKDSRCCDSHTNNFMHEHQLWLSDGWLWVEFGWCGCHSRWVLTHTQRGTEGNTGTNTSSSHTHARLCRHTYHWWVHGARWESVRFANLWETELSKSLTPSATFCSRGDELEGTSSCWAGRIARRKQKLIINTDESRNMSSTQMWGDVFNMWRRKISGQFKLLFLYKF